MFRKAWQWFFEALFPPSCIISGKEGTVLAEQYRRFVPPPENEAEFLYLDEVRAVTAYYDEVVKKVVAAFKFRGFSDLASIMGQTMACHVDNRGAVLVPIPLHWTRQFWRGFNQAELLAQEIKKVCPSMMLCSGLKRIKRTSQQAKAEKQKRKGNMAGAFAWDSTVKLPSSIVLIDDVVTTGATLDEAAKCLKSLGVGEVKAVVFARAGKGLE